VGVWVWVWVWVWCTLHCVLIPNSAPHTHTHQYGP